MIYPSAATASSSGFESPLKLKKEESLTVVLDKWNMPDLVSVLEALNAVHSGSVEVFIKRSKVVKIQTKL